MFIKQLYLIAMELFVLQLPNPEQTKHYFGHKEVQKLTKESRAIAKALLP